MFKPSSKRKIQVASGIFLTALVVASGFTDFWSLFSTTPFFQWALARWPAMTMPVYLSLKLLVYVTAVTAALTLLYMILKAIHRQEKDYGWLEALAQDHSKTMQDRVQIIHEKLSVTLNLNDTPQYVIFHITIFNRSIYPLTLEEKVYEHFTFEGTRLMEEARIHETKAMTAKPVNYFCFSIKQYIPSSVASHIQSPEASTFGTNTATVRFTYRDYTGAPKQVRVPLARQIPAPPFSTFNFACQLPIIDPD